MHGSEKDREQLIDAGFRFVSWLRKHFPEVKDKVLEDSVYDSYGEFVRQTPTLFWGYVGSCDYPTLTRKSDAGESILDRIVAIVKRSPPAVENEILVGFAEGHMFRYPDSSLARELSEALGHDRLGDVW